LKYFILASGFLAATLFLFSIVVLFWKKELFSTTAIAFSASAVLFFIFTLIIRIKEQKRSQRNSNF